MVYYDKVDRLSPEYIRNQHVYAVSMAEKNIYKATHILEKHLKGNQGIKEVISALNYYKNRSSHGAKKL